LINSASAVAFLVGNDEKKEILARVLDGDQSLPAARVRAEWTVMLAEAASVEDEL
jgi:6-phosphogluconolactonase/glucosamine-6-phosphate isomerase/deaminase